VVAFGEHARLLGRMAKTSVQPHAGADGQMLAVLLHALVTTIASG